MAIDDRERHRLHQRLGEVLGAAEAATLMAHLPPVGWLDVTTNSELTVFRREIDARFDAVDARFDAVDARLGAMDERIGAMDERLDARFEAFDARLGGLRSEIGEQIAGLRTEMHQTLHEHLRVFIFTFVACLATFASVMVAAIKL